MSTPNMIDDDAFIFAGQENEIFTEENDETTGQWRILIVDDEPEVHKVSQLALDNLNILGKKLEFLNAYSAQEALDLLQREQDIAVILLDVVMESDDAGLKAVMQIRDELKLTDVRIILRTGQPGYAPEEQVVMEYDINDYRTKTELTRNKLLTSVFSAIRSYSQIVEVKRSKDFLAKLNRLSTQLISLPNHADFLQCLVGESTDIFGLCGEALFLIEQVQDQEGEEGIGYWQAYGTEKFEASTGQRYEASLPSHVVSKLSDVIKTQEHLVADDCLIIFIKAQSCSAVLYMECVNQIELSPELVQTYVSNVASELDNSLLLQRISEVAYSCPLTGLPNRTHFIELLDDLTTADAVGNSAALIDLDHFSDINDGLGQEVGNSLLRSVAQRLRQSMPDIIVARIGADIFGLIGPQQQINHETVLSLFEKPFKADEHLIPVNASIGICQEVSKDKTGLAVLKHANIALNKAKKDIRSRHSFYNAAMEDETSWRLGMIRKLNSDFKDNKLEVWYQPQLRASNQEVVGVEALLRWPDGNGGYISPMTFIPLAEYSGLIVDIGAWVIEESCRELDRLAQLGLSRLHVAVNVSMPQFRNSGFANQVVSIVERFGIEPKRLELEITESVVMDDPKLVVQSLDDLQKAGFKIAIDDFGTGFSSLSYLKQLPIDCIKVDREFIKGIGEGDSGIIAETVIRLGQRLGLETVAEGIETEFQLNWINQLGCDLSQGFLHAKPMPSNELKEYLQNNCSGEC